MRLRLPPVVPKQPLKTRTEIKGAIPTIRHHAFPKNRVRIAQERLSPPGPYLRYPPATISGCLQESGRDVAQ